MLHKSSAVGSEFALPQKVYDLVLRIQQELLAPLRTSLGAATASRDRELQATRSRRETAQAEIAALTAEWDVKLNAAESTARRGLATVKMVLADADSFLQEHGLSPGAPHRSFARPELTEAFVASRTKELKARVRPRYWPRTTEAQLGLCFASAVMFFVYAPYVMAWPIFVYAAILFWDWDTRSRHALIAGDADRLSADIQDSVDEVRARAQAAISAARKSKLDPVVRDSDAADRATHARFEETRRAVESQWISTASSLSDDAAAVWPESGLAGAGWRESAWQNWTPDDSPEFGARIGTLTIDATDLVQLLPKLKLHFTVPSLVPFSSGQCLLLEAEGSQRPIAAEALKSVLMRIIATCPPGKARLTLMDPVGLGQNVAEFMALGDHAKELIAGRAWTEPRHIAEQLAELTAHMEVVIQKYLRNEFASILDYNKHAQEVAEPFRFLVVFDFPTNFNDESARRLVSIVRNGPRCGVFTLIVRDSSKPLPYGFSIDDLNLGASRIAWDVSGVPKWLDPVVGVGTRLETDAISPFKGIAQTIVKRAGEQAARAMKVEVPFDKMLATAALTSGDWWCASSAKGLKVPIGPTGARRLQYLALGAGLAHHALVVGRTGSGKTNLMHVIISALAMIYSPDELQLYLVDFKGGVGFKPYAVASLPHAAVIAIESERDFGMSVLNGLDAMLRERSELFRKAGVDNLSDYRERNPHERLQRILLVVDEYQEFFSPPDDAIAQQAKAILDRIVRQGRSFGIHILLGTQSLAGNAQLPTSTLGQMAIRIALPCHEADARAIFAEDNRAARVLTRPGEAIYNSAAGLLEGNNPFQVAHFSDQDLQRSLDIVTGLANQPQRRRLPAPVIFEGSEPAILEQSPQFATLLRARRWSGSDAGRAWLGEPVAMAPPVQALFSRKPGRHLLVVDRDEKQGLGMIHAAWFSLLCQHRPTTARFYVLDLATADTEGAQISSSYRSLFDHQIEILSRRTTTEVLADIVRTIQVPDVHTQSVVPPVYVLVNGLQRAKDIRWSQDLYYNRSESDATLPELFATVLKDGPEANVHVLAWCDTVGNARRAVDRHIAEFGIRVAGPMSLDDSSVLLDAPDAARLTRPHRLLYFDEERPGIIQKFRPYSSPRPEWTKHLSSEQRQWES